MKYQKDSAAARARNLIGVRSVTNAILVQPKSNPRAGEIKYRIFEAFGNAELEARRIGIDVTDGKVVLHGNVHDWSEVSEAQRPAWAAPGVSDVENRLTVVP